MTRFVVAGSVSTTQTTVEALQACGANLVGMLGLREASGRNVSGYVNLKDVADERQIPYLEFTSINSEDVVDQLAAWTPDYVFVVGLSQLVKAPFLQIPKNCCIGFHPTRLPEGRGRAPIAWLVMKEHPGAATLFAIDEGADSGQILEQVPFDISASDYAEDVLVKANAALEIALKRLVPRLMAGDAVARTQDEAAATYYGKRSPDDGVIDWNQSAEDICRLVRGTSRPHPGAYSYHAGTKLTVWRAEVERSMSATGVIGGILATTPEGHLIVQTGSGLVKLIETEGSASNGALPRVGEKLGISPQNAIHELTQRVSRLEQMIEVLLRLDGNT